MRPAEITADPVATALQQLQLAVASEDLPEDFMKILDEIDAKIAAARNNLAG